LVSSEDTEAVFSEWRGCFRMAGKALLGIDLDEKNHVIRKWVVLNKIATEF
jgi:hypothetical protein